MSTTNADNQEGGRYAYIRRMTPEELYRAAQRSWYEREIETVDEFFTASIASELTEALSDELLGTLGESGVYPLAEELLETVDYDPVAALGRSALDIETGDYSLTTREEDLEREQRMQIAKRATAFVENCSREGLESIVVNFLTGEESLFGDFEDDAQAELYEARKRSITEEISDLEVFQEDWKQRQERQKRRSFNKHFEQRFYGAESSMEGFDEPTVGPSVVENHYEFDAPCSSETKRQLLQFDHVEGRHITYDRGHPNDGVVSIYSTLAW